MALPYQLDGLQWAFQGLRVRHEVGAAMEEMLDVMEHWSLANEIELLKARLAQEEEQLRQARAENKVLLKRQAEYAAEKERNRVQARECRDKLVEDLLAVARDVKKKNSLQRRLGEAQKLVERLPVLEKELHKTQKELKDGQRKLSQLKALMGKGVLTNGNRASLLEQAFRTPSTAPLASSPPPSYGPQPQQQWDGYAMHHPHQPPPGRHTFSTTFMSLEEKLLLKMFSYLNAVDVLAVAEVCKPFYERVGIIFGKPTTTPSTNTTGVSGGGLSGSPTPSTIMANGDGGVPPSKASAAAKSILDDMPITDKIASSIASKLTSAEMKGIIGLTEKLRKLEGVLIQMQAENEDIRARLQGTESVKDFLVSKLKDTELALKKAMDGGSAAARQRSSDQEVITFLDSRVQELEMTLSHTSERLRELEEASGKDKLAQQEQVRVLKDMVSFEKHRAEDMETQFKNQKKLLVKEVKTLRSEVIARQAERDAYRQQLHELRQSVAQQLRRGGSTGSNSSGGSFR